MAHQGRGGQGVDGPPAVPDRADRGPGHDQAPPVQQGHRAGRGDPAQRGPGLTAPLALIEQDRAGRAVPGQARGDGVDPPRPQRAAGRQAGGDRHRGHQQAGPEHGVGGQQAARRAPSH